ncbi:hypothetical protein N7505_001390 [Penicillium chrysogenum]|uniref:Uncharacterized protein n=1 Tax=Penicillium chrysogenum TaxID=5076 RepID=A0ABQ8WWI7_PENCH|nr:hypothetical protein N7505_001390 [Penicillium chrysogenum]
MTPGYPRYIEPTSAPTALDNFSVHRTVTENPDLDMSSFSSVDFPIMTASTGLVNGINSENLYGEDMVLSTYTQLSPGRTGADAYTADWERFRLDEFSTGDDQLLAYMTHVFTPYTLRFPSPLLFNGTGEVKELDASSNYENEGTSQSYPRRICGPSTSAAQS